MLFNSLHFLFFFIVVTSLYFAFPHNRRWFLLLIASCYFYMAFVPIYILILAFTIVIDYFAGIFIEDAVGKRKKVFLICSLLANVGVLAVFKYYNFINSNLSFLFSRFHAENPIPYLSLLLPIGLSFHTFQAMSYTIEVYRGHQKAERHFGLYSLYVMFYPQLVAGPIERPQNLLHQFKAEHKFNYDDVTGGLRLVAWGLFKKVVIADRLAKLVDIVYSNPTSYNSLSLLIATVFFAYQIYCDFSGYSDMALGLARVMGFKLMINFERPFSSKSVSEFWRRWHISLSTWLRDYLYTPLSIGTRNWGTASIVFSLMVTFLISGLWHGAGWKYVIFGGLHGFYVVFALLTLKLRTKINKKLYLDKVPFLQVITTFILVDIAWIFFRADRHSAFYIVKQLFTGWPKVFHLLTTHSFALENFEQTNTELILCIGLIVVLETVQYILSRKNHLNWFIQRPAYIRWACYYGIVLSIMFLGIFQNRQFIYFQF